MNSSRDGRWRERVQACRRIEGKIITKGDTRVWAKGLCSWCRAMWRENQDPVLHWLIANHTKNVLILIFPKKWKAVFQILFVSFTWWKHSLSFSPPPPFVFLFYSLLSPLLLVSKLKVWKSIKERCRFPINISLSGKGHGTHKEEGTNYLIKLIIKVSLLSPTALFMASH